MLTKRIIPCLDVKAGRVVKGIRFLELRDAGDAAEIFCSQCIVVAIDAKRVNNHWEVFTHGGRNPTGIDACEWAKRMEDYGAGEILLTSMDRDGTKAGYDLELTRAIADGTGIPVIASGGVGNLEHIYEGFTQGHASAALAWPWVKPS